ncbi:MAG TPA: hypothetical protein PLD51_03110, partial [Pontiellaceae bacterium]|nr:hypothetical protein [Pontiellaceae bacterium]
MKQKTTSLMATLPVLILCGGLAVYLLSRWFAYDPARGLTRSLPGMDGSPAGTKQPVAGNLNVDLTGTLEKFDGVPSGLPGAWPRFRGPDSDNICKAEVKLADSWPESGPEILWSVALGEGHAA